MSKFDGNPFDEESPSNPYATGISHGRSPKTTSLGATNSATPFGVSGSLFDQAAEATDRTPMGVSSGFGAGDDEHMPSLRGLRPLPPESRAGSAFDAAGNIPFSPKTLKRKQKELQAREAQLRRKEQELASREETLGVAKPNWPPFWPLIRHDICADIPEYLWATQRAAFFSWMGVILGLSYNLLAVTVAWAIGAISFTYGMVGFFTAIIFWLLGVPLSFFLWYRRLYNSFKNDSGIGLVLFFISYLSHIGWFIVFAIAPPIYYGGCFMTGVLSTINLFAAGQNAAGIMYAIGTSLFVAEVALSVYVIGQVYAYFRGTGKANQLKQEAAMAALRNAV